MPWCPRCGTSLSQHELIDSYREIGHPRCSSACRSTAATASSWWSGRRRPGRCRRTWRPRCTRTPTTPGSRRASGIAYVAAAAARSTCRSRAPMLGTVKGSELVGLRYSGPFDELPAQDGVEHRVVAWDDVSRRRAPASSTSRRAAAPRTSSWVSAGAGHDRARRRGGRVLRRLRLAARPPHRRRRPADRRGPGAARPDGRGGRDHPPLSRLLAVRNRADLPAGRRVVHPLRRDPRADDHGRPRGGVEPAAVRQADGGLAAQHGRLVHQPQALLGPAAAVLLLRRRAHDRGRVAGRAGRDGAAWHGQGQRAAPSLDRRGGDRLR